MTAQRLCGGGRKSHKTGAITQKALKIGLFYEKTVAGRIKV